MITLIVLGVLAVIFVAFCFLPRFCFAIVFAVALNGIVPMFTSEPGDGWGLLAAWYVIFIIACLVVDAVRLMDNGPFWKDWKNLNW